MVTQMRKIPFGIYINFNYIEYLNQTGFNYIIHNSDYSDLKPFVRDIIDEYIKLLDEFLTLLKDKYEDKNERNYIEYFDKLLIREYKLSKEVALVNLSLTCDVHFSTPSEYDIFFDRVASLRKEDYKLNIWETETVLFVPWNRSLQIKPKNIPKIRFYDKQKDTCFRYYKKKKLGNHYFLLKSYDDVNLMERFEAIDIYSQEAKTLEQDFTKAYSSLDNTLRIEVEYNRKSIKQRFGHCDFFKLKIDNEADILDTVRNLFDMETVSFKDTIYHDQVTGFKEVVDHKKAQIDIMDCSGDLTEKFNFVIKNSEFLNSIRHPSSDTSQSSVWSKLNRLRRKGVVTGRGKNTVLNDPYFDLLKIYNRITTSDSWYYNHFLKTKNKNGGSAKQIRRLR